MLLTLCSFPTSRARSSRPTTRSTRFRGSARTKCSSSRCPASSAWTRPESSWPRFREVGARGVTRNARLNPRSASGEIIPTTLNASALRDSDGTVIGAIGILRDMRAYEMVVRDLEESRRKLDDANRAKDEFLATLSHELRTPLNAILGWVRLLRSGTLDPTGARRGPEIIERNTRVLAQLIEDLLDVSRIITGKLRLDIVSVDLVSVVVAAMEAVQAAADAKAIRLEASLDPCLGPVPADPDRLQQVVWNLLTNAIKFTPSGGRVDVGR